MNLEALRSEARLQLGDNAQPYFWANEWLDARINEAIREACIRARLIEDSSSPASSIDIEAGVKEYDLHEAVIDVLEAQFASNDRIASGWTLTETKLRFLEAPRYDDTLNMRVVRMPLTDLSDDSDEPEIRRCHHERLIDWVLHKAYLVQDADTFDPAASARHLGLFEAAFGQKHTASAMRQQRDKSPRVVKMGVF